MINRQFSLHRGDTWPGFLLTVTAADPVNDPVDFTGATVASDIRGDPNGPLITAADLVVSAMATSVEVTVFLTAAKSALLQGTVVSDVELTLADGRVFTPLRYQLNVTADATRAGAGAVQVTQYSGSLASSGSAVCGPITATIVTLPIPIVTGSSSGGGVTDHGALTGLADDDHAQYLTNARGDARYQAIIGNELQLRTPEGDVVTITVIKIGGVYNLRVGQPT